MALHVGHFVCNWNISSYFSALLDVRNRFTGLILWEKKFIIKLLLQAIQFNRFSFRLVPAVTIEHAGQPRSRLPRRLTEHNGKPQALLT